MKRILAVLIVTLAAQTAAQAHGWDHRGYGYGNAGAVVAGAIVGAALVNAVQTPYYQPQCWNQPVTVWAYNQWGQAVPVVQYQTVCR